MDTETVCRFFKHVGIDPGGCWLWTSAVAGSYGVFCLKVDGCWTTRTVHRLSWELEHGPVPDGMWVLHRCDTPLCVRPDHLYLGDHAQNMRDMVERRRFSAHSRKLTDGQVLEIREKRAAGRRPMVLSREYGVSPSVISGVVHGKTYWWLGGPRTKSWEWCGD